MIIPILGTAALTGIPYTTWGNERKEAVGAYLFAKNNTELHVTVDEVSEDDLDSKNLLDFLAARGVIDNPQEWQLKSMRDTDGLTFTDESFTTAVFVRTSSS